MTWNNVNKYWNEFWAKKLQKDTYHSVMSFFTLLHIAFRYIYTYSKHKNMYRNDKYPISDYGYF